MSLPFIHRCSLILSVCSVRLLCDVVRRWWCWCRCCLSLSASSSSVKPKKRKRKQTNAPHRGGCPNPSKRDEQTHTPRRVRVRKNATKYRTCRGTCYVLLRCHTVGFVMRFVVIGLGISCDSLRSCRNCVVLSHRPCLCLLLMLGLNSFLG